MGILGLSFGKQSSKSNSNVSKNETTNQSQTSNSTSNQTNNTNSNTSSTGSSSTNQSGVQTNTGVKTSTGSGSTSLFGQNVLNALETSVLGLLPGAGGAAASLVSSGFDAESFINDTMKSAQATTQTNLDAALGGINDMVGAGSGNSSMGTLLAQRANNDATANLAGVRAGAEKGAADIVQGINATRLASSGQSNDVLTQILGALKGGVQTTTNTGGETTSGTATSENKGTTVTSEQSATQTQAMQTIQQLVSALLSGTTSMTGTESTKGSGTQIGASLNLGK